MLKRLFDMKVNEGFFNFFCNVGYFQIILNSSAFLKLFFFLFYYKPHPVPIGCDLLPEIVSHIQTTLVPAISRETIYVYAFGLRWLDHVSHLANRRGK